MKEPRAPLSVPAFIRDCSMTGREGGAVGPKANFSILRILKREQELQDLESSERNFNSVKN